MRFDSEALKQCRREPRFADAGLTGQEHDLAFACPRLRPAPQQKIKFLFPTNKLGQSARMQCFEAAFDQRWSQDSPGSHRLGDALDVFGSEVLKIEQIAEKFARALRDDDHVRFGDALQTRGNIRGLTDNRLLLSGTRSDQVANDDQAGGNTHSRLQRSIGLQLAYCHNQFQSNPYRPLRVIFMGLGIAEVD
jgi:hypothetical protein